MSSEITNLSQFTLLKTFNSPHYDNIRGLCCEHLFCIIPSNSSSFSGNKIPEPALSWSETIKGLPFKLIFIGILLLFALWTTYWVMQKIKLSVYFDDQRKKSLTFPTFLMYIQYPKQAPALFIFSWFSFLFLLCEHIVNFLWPTTHQLGVSNYLALSIAATSVLFPLVVLIINGNEGARPSIFTTSEILLKYAFAFPISVMLLSILGLSAFPMNYYWMRLVVVAAVAMAAFALLRLLNITFGPKAWRKTEENLLRMQTQYAIKNIAAQRAGSIITNQKINSLGPNVTNGLRSFNNEGRAVYANKIGRLTTIHWKTISSIINSLEPPKLQGQEQDENEVENIREYSTKEEEGFQITITCSEEMTIESPDTKLAVFSSKAGHLTVEQIDESVLKLQGAFDINPFSETDLSMEHLDELFYRLSKMGMRAVEDDDEDLAKRISESYELIIKVVIKTFDELGVKYSLKEANQESPFWGNDWQPLTRLFDNIKDWTEKLLKAKNKSMRLQNTVIYTPYRIAVRALESRDLLSFSRSLSIAPHQQRFETGNRLIAKDWLISLARTYLEIELEENALDEKRREETLGYLQSYFGTLGNLVRLGIDAKNTQIFIQSVELLSGYPEIYRYDHFEFDIESEESRVIQGNESKEDKVRLTYLKLKQSLKEKVSNWRAELYVGLVGYCLFQLDSLVSPNKSSSEKEIKKMFNALLGYLPKNFIEIVKLKIEMTRTDASERWGWTFWGIFPDDGHVSSMRFHEYIDKVFAYLFLRSVPEGFNDAHLNSLIMYSQDVFEFTDAPNTVRKKTSELNTCALNLETRSKKDLETLYSWFDKIISVAILKSDKKLASTQISDEIVRKFKEDFERTFLERNRFRNLIKINMNLKNDKKERLKWGLNIIAQRGFFVKDPEVSSSSIGDILGSDLAQSEEGWIFKLIAEKANVSSFSKTATDLVQEALGIGLEAKNLLLIASRDIYSAEALRSDHNFRFDHQVESHKLKGEVNGFIEYNGFFIPVLRVFLHSNQLNNLPNLIAIDRNKTAINIYTHKEDGEVLEKTGFDFKLIDPLGKSEESNRLKDNFLAEDPNWLRDKPDQLKKLLVGLRLWLRVLEALEISFKTNPIGMYFKSNENEPKTIANG